MDPCLTVTTEDLEGCYEELDEATLEDIPSEEGAKAKKSKPEERPAEDELEELMKKIAEEMMTENDEEWAKRTMAMLMKVYRKHHKTDLVAKYGKDAKDILGAEEFDRIDKDAEEVEKQLAGEETDEEAAKKKIITYYQLDSLKNYLEEIKRIYEGRGKGLDGGQRSKDDDNPDPSSDSTPVSNPPSSAAECLSGTVVTPTEHGEDKYATIQLLKSETESEEEEPPSFRPPPPVAAKAPAGAKEPPPGAAKAPSGAKEPAPVAAKAPAGAKEPAPGAAKAPAGAKEPPPGAAKAPSGAKEPAPGVATAPSGAKEPAPGVAKAPSGAKEPAPGVAKAPSGAKEPAPGVAKAPPGAKEPAPGVAKAPAGAKEPAPGVAKAPSGAKEPAPGVAKAPAGAKEPAPGVAKAPAGAKEPAPGVAKAPAGAKEPAPGVAKAPSGAKEPAPGVAKAPSGAKEPAPGVAKAPAGAKEPAPGVAKAPSGAKEPAPGVAKSLPHVEESSSDGEHTIITDASMEEDGPPPPSDTESPSLVAANEEVEVARQWRQNNIEFYQKFEKDVDQADVGENQWETKDALMKLARDYIKGDESVLKMQRRDKDELLEVRKMLYKQKIGCAELMKAYKELEKMTTEFRHKTVEAVESNLRPLDFKLEDIEEYQRFNEGLREVKEFLKELKERKHKLMELEMNIKTEKERANALKSCQQEGLNWMKVHEERTNEAFKKVRGFSMKAENALKKTW